MYTNESQVADRELLSQFEEFEAEDDEDYEESQLNDEELEKHLDALGVFNSEVNFGLDSKILVSDGDYVKNLQEVIERLRQDYKALDMTLTGLVECVYGNEIWVIIEELYDAISEATNLQLNPVQRAVKYRDVDKFILQLIQKIQ